MRFRDIPQITWARYHVNSSWDYLEETLEHYKKDYGLELEPDFQRAHVWTEEKQVAYVEWILRGGTSGKDIYFNCPGFQSIRTKKFGPMQLVDGLQRVTAVRRFMNNEIRAFGRLRNEYEGSIGILQADFIVHINDLPTRKQVLQWYLDMNGGGVVHTNEELEKVKKLLEEENAKKD